MYDTNNQGKYFCWQIRGRQMAKSKMISFEIDTYKWILPVSITVNLVGNNHRVYNVIISFLCFHLIVCVDEDAR